MTNISLITTPIRFHLPDGSSQYFDNSTEAQQWFDQNYKDGYSVINYVPTQGDSEHPIQLQEVTITAPKSKSTKKGVDRFIGANYSPRFNAAYDKLGMNPLNWHKYIPTSYWNSNTHKAINEGNNIAAGIAATPFMAYGATQYALPWVTKNIVPYISAQGWLGATQAAGNTPAWLTPTSATAIDAVLAGSGTGAAINDMRENGPTVGNVLGTVLGVGGLAYTAAPTLMEGIQAGQKTYNTYKLGKELNKAANSFDGTVGTNYFRSPSNWYRVTESPEIIDIQHQGMNTTTRDIDIDISPAGRFRVFAIHNQLKPGIGENEGYWILPKKKGFNFTKRGSAHGNTSQAAKGQIWRGTYSRSRLFPGYVIEGEGPIEAFRGFDPKTGADSRTNFVKVPWEDIPFGARIGFHTGEMPMEGLRAFRTLPNDRYQYEGPILPNKTIKIETTPSRSIYDDYDLEEYSKNLSITPTKLNNEAQRYYDRVVKPLLKTDRPLFNRNNKKALILDEVPGESENVFGIHYSDNGENIIARKGNMINTGIHEIVSHGTDDIVPYESMQKYSDLIGDLLDNYYGPITEGSASAPEFRASMNEIRKQLQKYWLKKGKVDLTEIDKVPDKELIKLMRDVNSYGATYQKAYKQLPEQQQSEWILRFKNALKTLPVVSGMYIGLQNNEKD